MTHSRLTRHFKTPTLSELKNTGANSTKLNHYTTRMKQRLFCFILTPLTGFLINAIGAYHESVFFSCTRPSGLSGA